MSIAKTQNQHRANKTKESQCKEPRERERERERNPTWPSRFARAGGGVGANVVHSLLIRRPDIQYSDPITAAPSGRQTMARQCVVKRRRAARFHPVSTMICGVSLFYLFFFALRAYLFSSLPSFAGFFLPGIASENRYFPLEAVSNRFYRVLPGFAGFYWVLPSFISSFEQEPYSWRIFTTLKNFVQFSRALRSLNGFSRLYRVLPGFTGFYRVL